MHNSITYNKPDYYNPVHNLSRNPSSFLPSRRRRVASSHSSYVLPRHLFEILNKCGWTRPSFVSQHPHHTLLSPATKVVLYRVLSVWRETLLFLLNELDLVHLFNVPVLGPSEQQQIKIIFWEALCDVLLSPAELLLNSCQPDQTNNISSWCYS